MPQDCTLKRPSSRRALDGHTATLQWQNGSRFKPRTQVTQGCDQKTSNIPGKASVDLWGLRLIEPKVCFQVTSKKFSLSNVHNAEIFTLA